MLYFHSALEGKKIEIIHSNPEVSFQVITDSKLVTGQNACEDWTMKYRSVVGNGYASIIEDPEEKIRDRLAKASEEMEYANRFDIILMNDRLEDALKNAEDVIAKFLS